MPEPQSIAETNARAAARGVYYRWLLQQYGNISLVELGNDTDPISLRQIYIPMRLDTQDIEEEKLPTPDKFDQETEQNRLGQDAFEAIIHYDFLVLSGRPGSGKTTLVKALVNELAGSHSSPFRNKFQQTHGMVLPIPIILREMPNLADIQNLDDLLAQWWQQQQQLNQAQNPQTPLDIARLSSGIEHDKMTWLIVFDGIDEIGAFETRKRLLTFAHQAVQGHHRIMITGRPSGLKDLQSLSMSELKLMEHEFDNTHWMHLLPFTRPQIETFIHKWYRLHPELSNKQATGIKEFLDALHDAQRPYLLSLARRPIFLTLMALVHCSLNEMPHGRAALYKAIVDLYMERQQKHRRLQTRPDGTSMRQWDSKEPRMMLGYLAWLSMCKGAEQRSRRADDRRIIWKRDELILAIREALQGDNRHASNLIDIKAEDAESLLDYFLYPTGMLIDPADDQIQFAHLSFQEYLCAEYLHDRYMSSTKSTEKKWRSEVLDKLTQPGWDEVAMLLLAIKAERSQNVGQFELLSYLDIRQPAHTTLLYQAMLGRELPIRLQVRQAWLPLLIAAGLLHSQLPVLNQLQTWNELAEPGLVIMLSLLQQTSAEQVWQGLSQSAQQAPPLGFNDAEEVSEFLEGVESDWLTPKNSDTWVVQFDAKEAQTHALLQVLLASQWGQVNDLEQPVQHQALQAALQQFLQQTDGNSLWQQQDGQWYISTTAFAFDVLANKASGTMQLLQQQMPCSLWLLQGESLDFDFDLFSTVSVLSAIYGWQAGLLPRTRLALFYYQWQLMLEAGGLGRQFDQVADSRSRSLSRSLSLSLSLSYDLELYQNQADWYGYLKRLLDEKDPTDKQTKPVFFAYQHVLLNWASQDWFNEQAEQPALLSRRGGRVNEPLPRHLGILDAQGRIKPLQSRDNWLGVQAWMNNDEHILNFVFPELKGKGLNKQDEALLRADMADIRRHNWSPYHFMQALLDDWPEEQTEQDWSFEAAEQHMIEQIKQLAAKLDPNGELMPPAPIPPSL